MEFIQAFKMEINVENQPESLDLELEFVRNKLQKENEMRKDMKFCDLTLKINGKDEFRVHKNIIASSCPYFTRLFNGDWRETRAEMISLDYEISSECFEIMIEYLYTGKLGLSKFSYENAMVLHKAANFFDILTLKNIISKILQLMIKRETILNLWHHAVNYCDHSLRNKCLEFIWKNSIDFLNRYLLELTFEELKFLCDEKVLNCVQEHIYENIIKWIKDDFLSREKYLNDAVNLVDLSKVSGAFMQLKILNDDTLLKNKNFIGKIIKILSSNSFQIVQNYRIANTIENNSKKLNVLLISNTGIFKVDLKTKICQRLLGHINNRINFAITKFGYNDILITGGNNEYYCPHLNIIQEFPSMIKNRQRHQILAFGDKIYAFGGHFNSTMEIFDINTGKWTVGPNMPRPRWNFALEEYGGAFYLMGGYDGNNIGTIPTDIFDVREMKWTSSSSLKEGRLKSFRFDNSGYLFSYEDYRGYNFENELPNENNFLYQKKLDKYDVVQFNKEIFIFGKKICSGQIYSAIIDIETDRLKEIEIDLTQCDDIGEEFHLTTAYF